MNLSPRLGSSPTRISGGRRRSVASRDNRGYVLSPTDVDPIEKTKAKASFYPGDDIEDQTAADYGTVEAVRASSYGSIWRPLPRDAPPRALDADPTTAWRPASERSLAGEWIELDLAEPTDVRGLTVRLRTEIPSATGNVRLSVSTDDGVERTTIDRTSEPQELGVPSGPTSKVRLTIEDVDGPDTGFGIAEIEIPGAETTQRLVAPSNFPSELGTRNGLPIYVFAREPSSASIIDPLETETVMRRRFVVPRAESSPSRLTCWPSRRPTRCG